MQWILVLAILGIAVWGVFRQVRSAAKGEGCGCGGCGACPCCPSAAKPSPESTVLSSKTTAGGADHDA
ncbi:FeoB-associated Cys-rich membrane protein [Aminiphilus sp.]|uniref:FeoB-associated Cys-rich membrane protein n=1 Tax=Aminiphilus sp. TaxID=1872488 RepID=UPI002608CA08|nr:FeoB-associated Cys-rich membrane protein [Aminiphilus sp.]